MTTTLHLNTNNYGRFLDQALGIERYVRQASAINNGSFPPYNIEKFSDDSYKITLAIAGYSKEDINITLDKNLLTVKSIKQDKPDLDALETRSYIVRNIAERSFKTEFVLHEYMEIANAIMENGLLTIDIVINVPEEKKPKIITIS